ncbi:MAG: hypothetical protein RR843_04620, partial [Clostridia bacterium]
NQASCRHMLAVDKSLACGGRMPTQYRFGYLYYITKAEKAQCNQAPICADLRESTQYRLNYSALP